MLRNGYKPLTLCLTVTRSNDCFFFGYLSSCIDNIRPVSWQGDLAWHHLQAGVCSHGVVAFSGLENVFLHAEHTLAFYS